MKKRFFWLSLCILFFYQLPHGTAQEQNPQRPKVALVLAGGSAWGLAHIGVIRVIEELGIPVDMVVGTSMGSIVGGLYAAGYGASQMEEMFGTQDWSNIILSNKKSRNEPYYNLRETSRYSATIPFDKKGFHVNRGLLSGDNVLWLLDMNLLNVPSPVNFDSLPREFRAVAAELTTGNRTVFSEGSLADAIRASMSIPGFFVPWQVDGKYYIDGGVVDNLPIDVAAELGADIIIAIDLFKEYSTDENKSQNIILAINQLADIIFINDDIEKLEKADLLITVDVEHFLPTDFDKTRELAALGEAAARLCMEQLLEIRSRFPAESDNAVSPYPMAQLSLEEGNNFTITGELPADSGLEERIRKTLKRKSGKEDPLDIITKEIESTGRYQTVRLYRDSSGEGNPLVAALTPKPKDKNAVRLYFDFQTSISTWTEIKIDLVPALVINGLTTEDSQLLADLEIIDAPGIGLTFIQPAGSYVRLGLFFSALQDSSINFTSTNIGYLYNTFFVTGGVNLGVFPAGGMETGFSLSYDYVKTEFPDSGDDNYAGNYMLKTFFLMDKTDSPIFSSRGIAGSIKYQTSIGNYWSSDYFQTLELKGHAAIPLAAPVSLSLQWTGGTDFSFSPYFNEAPFYYLPNLNSHWMFPGTLQLQEKIGSHAAGAGIGINYQLNWRNKGITFPLFLLFYGNIGMVLQDTDSIELNNIFHWNTSFGAGLRINDAFGIAIRFGINQNTNQQESTAFFALDVGAISY